MTSLYWKPWAMTFIMISILSFPFVKGTAEETPPRQIDISMDLDLSFDTDSLVPEIRDGLWRFTAPGYDIPAREGEPFVPVLSFDVLIPPDTGSYNIDVQQQELTFLPFSGPVASVPSQVMIGEPGTSRDGPFTRDLEGPVEVIYDGTSRGMRVLTLRFDPVNPVDDGIMVTTMIEFSIGITLDERLTDRVVPADEGSAVIDHLTDSVINPDDMRTFGSLHSTPTGTLPNGSYRYVLITDKTIVKDAFDPLLEWKTMKGIPSRMYTTSMIYANYTGRNNQEKIRNFIIDAVATWGSDFVLLGGDVSIIPYRGLSASVGSTASNDIAADLYYSALDGDFNADNDTIWGETSDSVDLRYDVMVGRAPVETEAEARTFVSKTLTYEREPAQGYLDRVLLGGEYLDQYTNSSLGLDLIKSNLLPPNSNATSLFDKAYGQAGTLSKADFMSGVNLGAGLIFHSGHSNENVMSVGSKGGGSWDLYSSDVTNYNGGDRLGVLNSIGCITTRFNVNDCIAERHVKEPDGGTVAYIGNSRYGWYSPYNPGYGGSERYQYAMAQKLLQQGYSGIGDHFAAGKDVLAPYGTSNNVWRWLAYALNLIGDPEANVRTAEPMIPNVTHPDRIGLDSKRFTVTVRDDNGTPLKGALVCLRHSDYYEHSRTDDFGKVNFLFTTSNPDNVSLTVTGTNLLPYIKELSVDLEGPIISSISTGNATTGDPLIVGCSVVDNFEVGEVSILYYQGGDMNSTTPGTMIRNGTNFTCSIPVRPDSDEHICISIVALDVAGNEVRSVWKVVEVKDNDAPELTLIPSRSAPTTGDPYLVKVDANDNIAVANVTVSMSQGGTLFVDGVPMMRSQGDQWSAIVEMDPAVIGPIDLEFIATDPAGNRKVMLDNFNAVMDDDAPIFGSDLSDIAGTTGDPIRLGTEISDNALVAEAWVSWRFSGSDILTTTPLLALDDGYFAKAPLPLATMNAIAYVFYARDDSGNTNQTQERIVDVMDNDPPYLLNDQSPKVVTTGDRFVLSLKASDNLGVSFVSVTAHQGDSMLTAGTTMDLNNDGDFFVELYTLSGSVEPIEYSFTITDTQGNTFVTDSVRIIVEDDDRPTIVHDGSATIVEPGDDLEFVVIANDNIGVGSVTAMWWPGGSKDKRTVPLEFGEEVWTGKASIPVDLIGTIYYEIQVGDVFKNVFKGPRTSVMLLIPDPVPGPDPTPLPGDDLDGDGMEDLWESLFGLVIGIDDSLSDPDLDGVVNRDEYLNGTDPLDPESHPPAIVSPTDDENGNYIPYIVLGLVILLVIAAALAAFLFANGKKTSSDRMELGWD